MSFFQVELLKERRAENFPKLHAEIAGLKCVIYIKNFNNIASNTHHLLIEAT